MSPSHSPRIAVVGGGLSGLATAVQLHRSHAGLDVTLFEAGSRLGGVIQTERTGPYVLDYGADMFATQPSAAIELCRELGAEDRLIRPKEQGRGAKIVRRGRLVPVPDGFVLMRATKLGSILSTPILSPGGKLRLAIEAVLPGGPEKPDESVGSFVRRRMGREVLERLVQPLVAGIYTADVESLSMKATMPQIWEMERKYGSLARATLARRLAKLDSTERNSSGARYGQFRAFPNGMAELIELLAGHLPPSAVRYESAVDRLAPLDGGWEVTLATGIRESFDGVVLATPAKVASTLLRPISPVAAEELASIESSSAAIVVMVVERAAIQRPPATFGFVVPAIENRRILAASFASEKFAGRAPEDQVIIRTFLGGRLQPELLAESDERLIEIVREELGDLIGLQESPLLTRVVRWNDAMPQYEVGHLERVERIRRSLESVPGLWLTGNGLDGVGIAPVIAAAGRVAAEVVAAHGDGRATAKP